MRKEGFFFPAATRKDDMTDRQYRQENRTEQKRKEHSTAQHNNRTLGLCARVFSFPPSQG